MLVFSYQVFISRYTARPQPYSTPLLLLLLPVLTTAAAPALDCGWRVDPTRQQAGRANGRTDGRTDYKDITQGAGGGGGW